MPTSSTDSVWKFLLVTAALSHADRTACIGRSAYLSYSKVLTFRESDQEIPGLAPVEPFRFHGECALELHTRFGDLADPK